jgi:hypothetical protein
VLSIRTHHFIAEESDDWCGELIATFEKVEFENEEVSDQFSTQFFDEFTSGSS